MAAPEVVTFEADEDSAETDSYASEGGWVLKGWRWTFPAKKRVTRRGKKPRAGSLSIVIDLGRKGQPSRELGFPCVMVAWASTSAEWYEEFDGDVFWPVEASSYELRAERLLWWIGTDDDGDDDPVFNHTASPLEASWLYIIPLFAITDRDKLKALVVTPVLELISAKAPEQVFATTPEVIKFNFEGGKAMPKTPGA